MSHCLPKARFRRLQSPRMLSDYSFADIAVSNPCKLVSTPRHSAKPSVATSYGKRAVRSLISPGRRSSRTAPLMSSLRSVVSAPMAGRLLSSSKRAVRKFALCSLLVLDFVG